MLRQIGSKGVPVSPVTEDIVDASHRDHWSSSKDELRSRLDFLVSRTMEVPSCACPLELTKQRSVEQMVTFPAPLTTRRFSLCLSSACKNVARNILRFPLCLGSFQKSWMVCSSHHKSRLIMCQVRGCLNASYSRSSW